MLFIQGQKPGPSSLPKKHPLQNKWCLWYFKNDKSKEWKDNLKHVISFDTVSDVTMVTIGYSDVLLLVCIGRGFLGVSSCLSVSTHSMCVWTLTPVLCWYICCHLLQVQILCCLFTSEKYLE